MHIYIIYVIKIVLDDYSVLTPKQLGWASLQLLAAYLQASNLLGIIKYPYVVNHPFLEHFTIQTTYVSHVSTTGLQ